ncbi:zinc dependent phospholipase C family protein [Limibacter armeniacum]|uniref:zinc dependent phospholipase C family protein n=1 Tax=Limibacter armeniacum TaxID=466084 RepID=UPI002FE5FAE6
MLNKIRIHIKQTLLIISIYIIASNSLLGTTVWGFYAHKLINRSAVWILPPEMFGFYKKHIAHITELAVKPDERRYMVRGEAPKHFIDLDAFGDSALTVIPKKWSDAKEVYSVDTLMANGIAPWNIKWTVKKLTDAFYHRDEEGILKHSAELGHYIADIHVPLHTTSNYNGQLTNQYGIHGLWESRVPELYATSYDLLLKPAYYIEAPLQTTWNIIQSSNQCLDSIFLFEIKATQLIGDDKKYSYEERNGKTVRTYSRKFTHKYHQLLQGQVERRLRNAIQMVANLWYTCWVDAGQPNLDSLSSDIYFLPITNDSLSQPIKTRFHDF